MTTHTALLLLTSETPLHAGAGQSVDGIDLPIQREVHTHWPCVFGSAVKGALRAHAEQRMASTSTAITDLFGPDHGGAQERDTSHAGALLVGDATLLALPAISQPAPDKALGQGDAKLFLEEFRFEQSPDACIGALAKALAPLSGGALDEATLLQRLVVVHDDIFSFLAGNATSVQPHIAIDSTTKTVKDGALWFEETLPPETLLYVPLTATASRRKGGALTAAQVLEQFEQLLPAGKNWLQLGGNETTGMGWCRVGIARASAEQGV